MVINTKRFQNLHEILGNEIKILVWGFPFIPLTKIIIQKKKKNSKENNKFKKKVPNYSLN